MSGKPITFTEVFRRELAELRTRRRHRGQPEVGPPGPVEPDEGGATPHLFNALLDDLARRNGAFQPQASEAPEQDAPSAAEKAAAGGDDASAAPEVRPETLGLLGLALSGGGIRSASFCLGALQALDRFRVFSKIDYLSTVSGGGYIGASLSSLYADGVKQFPFVHQPGVPENGYLRHLRSYSNYLAPRGLVDYLRAPGIVLRGIVVNLIVLLPLVLLLTALSVWLNGEEIVRMVNQNRQIDVRFVVPPVAASFFEDRQTREQYLDLDDLITAYDFTPPITVTVSSGKASITGVPVRHLAPGEWLLEDQAQLHGFALELPEKRRQVTLLVRQALDARRPQSARADVWAGRLTTTTWLTAGLLAILAVYPILQWIVAETRTSNWRLRDLASYGLAGLVAALLVAAVVEFQPIAIYYYTSAWLRLRIGVDPPNLDVSIGLFAIAAVLVGTFSGRLAKHTHRMAGRIGLYAIGLLGPFVLWLLYLVLGRWALCGVPHWLSGALTLALESVDTLFGSGLSGASEQWREPASLCFGTPDRPGLHPATQALLWTYVAVAGVLLLLTTRTIDVNRTSLHQFYRDRLSKAFLLCRQGGSAGDAKPDAAGWRIAHNDNQALEALGVRPRRTGPARRRAASATDPDRAVSRWRRLLGLGNSAAAEPEPVEPVAVCAPYHLINAAMNTQSEIAGLGGLAPAPADASDVRDCKGRKAEFFVFSQHFVGSRLTGYCKTVDMRALDPDLDLGTAMAISAAAAAPNMGTSTIKPLVFLMTVLNIRLGYWLPNPGLVAEHQEGWIGRSGDRFGLLDRLLLKLLGKPGPIYLLAEMLGLLNAHSVFVNVSDGGHIENLGVYPLFQRRCQLIIAVDGERDPPVGDGRQKFSGLAAAIRYARIDLGIDVDIDLDDIGRDGHCHFAVGRIDYGPKFPPGWLIYVKSSLTGDENPYIREYALDRPAFPHESTGDQFFDEKQFECYRALGYHAMQDFLAQAPALDAATILSALRDQREGPRGAAEQPQHADRPALRERRASGDRR